MANSVEPDEMPHFLESDLGLHCLIRPVRPNTFGKYSSPMASQCHVTSFKFYLLLL